MHEKREYIIIICEGKETRIPKPQFGEVKIVVHQGKLKYVDSTERQKIE